LAAILQAVSRLRSFEMNLKFWKSELLNEAEVSNRGLHIWKDGPIYRWTSVFTNKFRDIDNPPEILSEAAHIEFVKAVEDGVEPYPELWHWHTPGTRWGIAETLHYDKDTGFLLAAGTVDKGHEKEAMGIMAMGDEIKVSHGMDEESIERKDNDKTVITSYASREISDLPARHAANQLTGFTIQSKEVLKMIPEEKKVYFRKLGMSDETIDALEADMDSKAKEAEGLEFKQGGEVITKAFFSASLELFGDEISKVLIPLAEAFAKLEEDVEELKQTDELKIAKQAGEIPAASIGAIFAKQLSAIGSTAAKIDGRSTLARDKPKEAIEDTTGIPFIDKMISEE
jgi:hypothetical protein